MTVAIGRLSTSSLRHLNNNELFFLSCSSQFSSSSPGYPNKTTKKLSKIPFEPLRYKQSKSKQQGSVTSQGRRLELDPRLLASQGSSFFVYLLISKNINCDYGHVRTFTFSRSSTESTIWSYRPSSTRRVPCTARAWLPRCRKPVTEVREHAIQLEGS